MIFTKCIMFFIGMLYIELGGVYSISLYFLSNGKKLQEIVCVLPTILKGEIVEQGAMIVLLMLSTHTLGSSWSSSEVFRAFYKGIL